MKRFGNATIQSIIKRACKEFLEDVSAPDFVSFFYNGHYVEAKFEWSNSRRVWFLSHFDVVYSRCVMRYSVYQDYYMADALCW